MKNNISFSRYLLLIGVVAVSIAISSGAQAQVAAPSISSIVASSTASGTAATVSWTTDQPADSQIQYGVNIFYGASTTLNTVLVTSHSQTLFGLTPDTTYHFQVFSANASGTMATSSDQIFVTSGTSTGTTTATSTPIFVSINATSTASGTAATVSWVTDVLSDSQVVYGVNTFYGALTTPDLSLVTNHSQIIFGLSPGTTYHYQVVSSNASGTATSSDQIFVTSGTSTATSTATTTATSTPTNGGITSHSTGRVRQIVGVNGQPYIFIINISNGMRSNYVIELQNKLRSLGYFTYPVTTGYFGPITLASVRAFQYAHNIPITGFVGPLTRAALNSI